MLEVLSTSRILTVTGYFIEDLGLIPQRLYAKKITPIYSDFTKPVFKLMLF